MTDADSTHCNIRISIGNTYLSQSRHKGHRTSRRLQKFQTKLHKQYQAWLDVRTSAKAFYIIFANLSKPGIKLNEQPGIATTSSPLLKFFTIKMTTILRTDLRAPPSNALRLAIINRHRSSSNKWENIRRFSKTLTTSSTTTSKTKLR